MRNAMVVNRRWVGRFLLTSALLLAACHTSQSGSPEPDEDVMEDTGPIALHIENHNYSDIVVRIAHASTETRLGIAGGLARTELTFPAAYARGGSPLVLIAAPIGSRERFTSERFFVQPGQEVTWTLEGRLAQSSLSIH